MIPTLSFDPLGQPTAPFGNHTRARP
jgi:hypothetical protein